MSTLLTNTHILQISDSQDDFKNLDFAKYFADDIFLKQLNDLQYLKFMKHLEKFRFFFQNSNPQNLNSAKYFIGVLWQGSQLLLNQYAENS